MINYEENKLIELTKMLYIYDIFVKNKKNDLILIQTAREEIIKIKNQIKMRIENERNLL